MDTPSSTATSYVSAKTLETSAERQTGRLEPANAREAVTLPFCNTATNKVVPRINFV